MIEDFEKVTTVGWRLLSDENIDQIERMSGETIDGCGGESLYESFVWSSRFTEITISKNLVECDDHVTIVDDRIDEPIEGHNSVVDHGG